MIRHVSTVLISALIGSFMGTLAWVGIEGGTGSSNPMRFIIGSAAGTLVFTVPGAALLMAATLSLADRGLRQAEASILVLVLGTLAGAAMLAFSSPYFMAVGAMFGGVTAAAFVAAVRIVGGYPAHRS